MIYTHVDADGMRWRWVGNRRISELADKVMLEAGFPIPAPENLEYIIMARPIEDAKPYEPVPITPHPCSKCGRICSISPSTVQLLKRQPIPVVCIECQHKLVAEQGEMIYAVTPEAQEEQRLNRAAKEQHDLEQQRRKTVVHDGDG